MLCCAVLCSRPAALPGSSSQVKTDWAALIDNWAVRFLHEMDYSREARNAALFREQMVQLQGARCGLPACLPACHPACLPRCLPPCLPATNSATHAPWRQQASLPAVV